MTSLVHEFMDEIEKIQDNKIRSFVVDALNDLANVYEEIKNDFVKQTKKTIQYAEVLLETVDASDYTSDIVLSALLLQDTTRYEYTLDENCEWYIKEDIMHPLTVRSNLLSKIGELDYDSFDNIMRAIESSHGVNSPIPHVIPSPEDSVFIWIVPFANSLSVFDKAYN